MSGPPPIPFVLKALRGNPGCRRMKPEPMPAIAPVCPEPPPFLTGYARDEWYRVAEQLHCLGLLTVIDSMPLAAYCASYARWRQAEEALAEMGKRDPVMHGLLMKSRDGNARRNPLIKVSADAADAMVRYAGLFGITPVARSRIAAGVHAQPGSSKFDGLIGGE